MKWRTIKEKMFMTITRQLEEAKKEVNVDFEQITETEFNDIKNRIWDNMKVTISNNSNFIWEQFIGCSNICGEFAWEHIAELVPKGECILFFNQIECKNAYRFYDSQELCEVIGETYNCEVYVTNNEGTYLISYNHEMILSGYGDAVKWVDKLRGLKE